MNRKVPSNTQTTSKNFKKKKMMILEPVDQRLNIPNPLFPFDNSPINTGVHSSQMEDSQLSYKNLANPFG